MKNLIIPMAGKSTRFPNMRPKWMLTHPMTNRFMAIESILGLNLDFFDNIYYVCLEEHEKKYSFLDGFVSELNDIDIENNHNQKLFIRQFKSQELKDLYLLKILMDIMNPI